MVTKTAILGEEDDGPQIVMLVEDEHGTEFKFSDDMPDTFGHSGTIGKIKAAIGDRDRIDVDAAGAFLYMPLLAAGAFAYLPPPYRAPRASRASKSSSPWSTCAHTVPSRSRSRPSSARTTQAKSIQI